ncbi:thermonuclease family protein [Aquimarina macrocephali]|uniref:thermonuclease family protein n=1 Tax=Aquimarina macrocephali TaxID=666563 RepID=UPI00373FDB25
MRLWAIDAPKKGEEGADRATNFLKNLVDQKRVFYTKMDIDKYGRTTVARIFLKDGRDVNRLLIESGHMKEYCKYSKNYYGQCG